MNAGRARKLHLRQAGVSEASLLADMHAAAFAAEDAEDAWDAKAMARLLALPGVGALIALVAGHKSDEPGEPAGFVMLRAAADEAEIVTFCVIPGWRRRGVGRRLLEAVMAKAADAGAQRLYLEVAADNLAAARLYEAAGFIECGRRKDYYRRGDGGAADARVLSRSLLDRKPGYANREI